MLKYKSKNLRGSFTIEAALIYPMIFIAIVSMIFLTLYLHDVVIFKSTIFMHLFPDTVSLSSSMDPPSEDAIESHILDFSFISRSATVSTAVNEQLSISGEISLDAAFLPAMNSSITHTATLSDTSVCAIVRRYNILSQIAKSIE